MVITLKTFERSMGNRGSKSDSLISVKEQRVYGCWYGCASYPYLRCTLTWLSKEIISQNPS